MLEGVASDCRTGSHTLTGGNTGTDPQNGALPDDHSSSDVIASGKPNRRAKPGPVTDAHARGDRAAWAYDDTCPEARVLRDLDRLVNAGSPRRTVGTQTGTGTNRGIASNSGVVGKRRGRTDLRTALEPDAMSEQGVGTDSRARMEVRKDHNGFTSNDGTLANGSVGAETSVGVDDCTRLDDRAGAQPGTGTDESPGPQTHTSGPTTARAPMVASEATSAVRWIRAPFGRTRQSAADPASARACSSMRATR